MRTMTDDSRKASGDMIDPHAELVVADSCRINGESIAWCLNAYGAFKNVPSVDSGADLMQLIRSQRPRVVLVGERLLLSVMRDLFHELSVRIGETRVVVFADGLTDRQLDLVVNNRVSGLLSRHDPIRVTSERLVQIAAGHTVMSDQLASRVMLSSDGRFECHASTKLQKLTDRQWDVLLRIAEGRRVAEVAVALEISEKAVESHKYRIMKAIGATDRVDLTRWAIREGLIEA
jgi:DNA-binding NarL/FixJ family response regulator